MMGDNPEAQLEDTASADLGRIVNAANSGVHEGASCLEFTAAIKSTPVVP